MIRTVLLTALAAALCGAADAPKGFHYWPNSTIKGATKTLAAKADKVKGNAGQPLADYGNHNVAISYREKNGQPEVHEQMNDIFVVEEGEATLIVGGKAEGIKSTTPGEWLGGKISGGHEQKLGPGDVVHIPNNTPHQLMVPAGKTFTYFVIKIAAPK